MSDLACSICEHYHQHLGMCGELEDEDIYDESACQCRADLTGLRYERRL